MISSLSMPRSTVKSPKATEDRMGWELNPTFLNMSSLPMSWQKALCVSVIQRDRGGKCINFKIDHHLAVYVTLCTFSSLLHAVSDFSVSSVPLIRWFHCLEVSLLQFGVAVLLLLTYVLVWKFLCCNTGSLFHPAFKFVTAPSSIQGRSFHLVPWTTGEFIILLYSWFASRIRNDFMIQLLVYKGNSRKNLIPKEVQ